MSKEKLEYLINNFGLYSEIIKIRCYKDKVSFIELGESGNNEISWNSNSIPNIFFNPHLSKEEENKSEELNSLIEIIKRIAKSPAEKGSHCFNLENNECVYPFHKIRELQFLDIYTKMLFRINGALH